MSTSVKMSERAKSKLEELQARIKLETGEKPTQQELLDRIVDRAVETEADLVDSFKDDGPDLTDEEIERWLSGTTASGDPLDEEDIDDVLYGAE